MSDIYTTEAQSQEDAATNVASRVTDGGKTGSQLRYFRATRVVGTTATDASTNVLSIIKLPDGARVLPETLKVFCDDPGIAYTIDSIGDLADADRYASTDMDIKAGGYFSATPLVTGVVNDYKVGDDATDTGWLTATLGTVTTPAAAADITFTGQYSIQN